MLPFQWNRKEKREQLTELMFEKYKVPAFFLVKNAVLAAYVRSPASGLQIVLIQIRQRPYRRADLGQRRNTHVRDSGLRRLLHHARYVTTEAEVSKGPVVLFVPLTVIPQTAFEVCFRNFTMELPPTPKHRKARGAILKAVPRLHGPFIEIYLELLQNLIRTGR